MSLLPRQRTFAIFRGGVVRSSRSGSGSNHCFDLQSFRRAGRSSEEEISSFFNTKRAFCRKHRPRFSFRRTADPHIINSNSVKIYICGGGAKNRYFLKRLAEILPGKAIASISDLGYDPDYLEATLWAYLGSCFIRGIKIDSSCWTGAEKPYIPGSLCLP